MLMWPPQYVCNHPIRIQRTTVGLCTHLMHASVHASVLFTLQARVGILFPNFASSMHRYVPTSAVWFNEIFAAGGREFLL